MTISLDDPFYSAKSRLERAKEKISELNTAIRQYRDEHPADLICEADEPDRRTKTWKFKFFRPFPDSWTHLPIEILEAVRSALDQAAYAAAKLSGSKRLKKTQFPIADSLDELQNLIAGRKVCKDVPPEIVAVFHRFNPYQGGNDTLWALNKLRNSTHTELTPIAVQSANIGIHHSSRFSGELEALNPIFNRAKYEIPFARASIDDHSCFAANPSFLIGFDERITGDRQAISFFKTAVNMVEDILEAVEIACIQLGYIRDA